MRLLPFLTTCVLAATYGSSPLHAQVQRMAASQGVPCEQLGHGIAIDGARLVAGAAAAADDPYLPCASGPGAACVFELVNWRWVQTQRLAPTDGGSGDEFGNSVAVWGDRIVVGSEHHDGSAGAHSGAAYVYELQDTLWVQVAKLEPADARSQQYFARSVAISGDWIVCGTRFDRTLGNQAGAAYTFQRDAAGNWVETQKLLASDGSTKDLFGNAVAIDGDKLVVGAYQKNGAGGNKQGAAYVYELQGAAWVQTRKLEPANPVSPAEFGRSVAIDRDRILIGARADGGVGAAHVFDRQGTTWVETAKLVPSDGASGDQFGESCDVDGDVVLVGARLAAVRVGAAYLFEKQGAGWGQTAKLLPLGSGRGWFGYNVALSPWEALVGAPFDLSAAGSATTFPLQSAIGRAREVVRRGLPPNPPALTAGASATPVLGAHWDPILDHTSFVPDSTLDVLGLSATPRNLPYPPVGTILCDLSNAMVFYATPGASFDVAIPPNAALVGATRCAMAGSFDAGGNLSLANALDIVIGSF